MKERVKERVKERGVEDEWGTREEGTGVSDVGVDAGDGGGGELV